MNFGTPIGTLAHLTGELFRIRTNIDIVVIPYKGAATAVTDILAEQVDMTFEPTSVLAAHIHDGKVRPLAVTGAARSIVRKLNTAINQGLQSPGMHSTLARLGAEAKVGSPQDFAAFIAEETQKWGAIVKSSGVKLN